MPKYTIKTIEKAAYYYEVEASNIDEAIKFWRNGDNQAVTKHGYTSDIESVSVKSWEDGAKRLLNAVFKTTKTKATKPAKRAKRKYTQGKYGMHNRMPAEVVKQIYQLATAGNLSYREIGTQFGVSKQTVENIKNNRYRYHEKLKLVA
jgi:DNA-binding transcriptional regulator YiaG